MTKWIADSIDAHLTVQNRLVIRKIGPKENNVLETVRRKNSVESASHHKARQTVGKTAVGTRKTAVGIRECAVGITNLPREYEHLPSE